VQRKFAAAPKGRRRPSTAELLARAERWRPWRAYAVLHLWMSDGTRTKTKTSPRKTKEIRHAVTA
jgi:AraC family transcriptional regulator of adaptative response / DNA-3-methyladenine glycosylase II